MSIASRIQSMYEHVGEIYDTISNVYVNTGKQLFDKDNAITLDKVSFTQSNEYYYVNNSSTKKMLFVPINATSPCSFTVSKTASSVFEITMFYAEPNTAKQNIINNIGYLEASRVVDNSATSLTISSTFPGITYKTLAIMYYSGDDTLTEQQILDSIMVNEGTEALPYEPYTDNPMYKNIENIPKVIQQSYLEIMNNGIDVVWDNWEKVLGEGTELTLSNTEQAPMKVLLKGNTYQDSTSGKNLLNVPSTYSVTGYNESTINIPSGTYVLSATKRTSTNSNTTSLFYFYEGQTPVGQIYIGGTQPLSKALNLTGNANRVLIYSAGNYTESVDVTTTFENLMISTSGGDYEPYTNGASPNPDFPQEVHTVSGDNTIEVVGKNLVEATLAHTNIGSTGALAYHSDYDMHIAKVVQGETYTMTTTLASDKVFGFFTNYPTINTYTYDNSRMVQSSYTFTAPITGYVAFRSATGYETPMLEKGSTQTLYEPYVSSSYQVNLGVENLFDKNNANVLNAYLSGYKILGYAANQTIYIPIIGNTTYTISKTIGVGSLSLAYTTATPTINGDTLGTITATSTTYTTTSPSNATYLCVFVKRDSDSDYTLEEILAGLQIVKGDKAQQVSDTPIELCKIGTYQDYIYKDNGSWYLHKEIGKVVLDGSENSDGITDLGTNIRAYFTKGNIKQYSNGYSNYFPIEIGTYNTDSTGILLTPFTVSTIAIKIPKSVLSSYDKTGIETWLSTHNTSVYYILATPTNTLIEDTTLIEQLEALNGAKSYTPQTNISQTNDDLPFILDVSALSDGTSQSNSLEEANETPNEEPLEEVAEEEEE